MYIRPIAIIQADIDKVNELISAKLSGEKKIQSYSIAGRSVTYETISLADLYTWLNRLQAEHTAACRARGGSAARITFGK